jgi:hypothetical protein
LDTQTNGGISESRIEKVSPRAPDDARCGALPTFALLPSPARRIRGWYRGCEGCEACGDMSRATTPRANRTLPPELPAAKTCFEQIFAIVHSTRTSAIPSRPLRPIPVGPMASPGSAKTEASRSAERSGYPRAGSARGLRGERGCLRRRVDAIPPEPRSWSRRVTEC